MDRKGDLISFGGVGWHKGFYNAEGFDDISYALLKIDYTKVMTHISIVQTIKEC